MRERPPISKRKELTAEQKVAAHKKYMKEMDQAIARTRTIGVSKEQADLEWQRWQEIQQEIHGADTEQSQRNIEARKAPPTLRPEVIEKVRDGGPVAIMIMTHREKENLVDYLDVMSVSDSPDAISARTLMQYFDPEIPMQLPEDLQHALKRLVGLE